MGNKLKSIIKNRLLPLLDVYMQVAYLTPFFYIVEVCDNAQQ